MFSVMRYQKRFEAYDDAAGDSHLFDTVQEAEAYMDARNLDKTHEQAMTAAARVKARADGKKASARARRTARNAAMHSIGMKRTEYGWE